MGKTKKNVCIMYSEIAESSRVLKHIVNKKAEYELKITELIDELEVLGKSHNNCFQESITALNGIDKDIENLYIDIENLGIELETAANCYEQAETELMNGLKAPSLLLSLNYDKLNNFLKNTTLLSEEEKEELENSDLNIYESREAFENKLTAAERKKLEETNATIANNANSEIDEEELFKETEKTGATVVSIATSTASSIILGQRAGLVGLIPGIITDLKTAAEKEAEEAAKKEAAEEAARKKAAEEAARKKAAEEAARKKAAAEKEDTLDDWKKVEDKEDTIKDKLEEEKVTEKEPSDIKTETDLDNDEITPAPDIKDNGDIIAKDEDDTTPSNTVIQTPTDNQNPNNNVQQNTYNPQNNQASTQQQSVQNNTQTQITPEVEQSTDIPIADDTTNTGDIPIIETDESDNVIKIDKPKITQTKETPSNSSGSNVIPIGLGVAAAGAVAAGGIKYVNDKKKNSSTTTYDENYDYEDHDLLKDDSENSNEDEQTYTDEYSNYSEDSIDSTSDLGAEPIDNSFKYQAGTVNKIAVEGNYEDDLNVEDLSLDDE